MIFYIFLIFPANSTHNCQSFDRHMFRFTNKKLRNNVYYCPRRSQALIVCRARIKMFLKFEILKSALVLDITFHDVISYQFYFYNASIFPLIQYWQPLPSASFHSSPPPTLVALQTRDKPTGVFYPGQEWLILWYQPEGNFQINKRIH